MDQRDLLHEAVAEAKLGLSQGGIPIGSVLADAAGKIVARGHNLRVPIVVYSGTPAETARRSLPSDIVYIQKTTEIAEFISAVTAIRLGFLAGSRNIR